MPEVDPQAGAAGRKLSPSGAQQNVLAAGGLPADSTPTSATKAPAPQAAAPRLIQPGPGYRIAQSAHALDPRQPLQVTSTAPITAAHPAHPSASNAPASAPAPPASALQPSAGLGEPITASAIQVAASPVSPAGPSLSDAFSTLLAMLVPQPLDASAYPVTLSITLNGTRAVVWTVPRAGSRPTMHSFVIPPQMQAAMHDPRTQSHVSWAALNELWRTAEAQRADSVGSQLVFAHRAATDARADVRQLQCRVSGLQMHIACAEKRTDAAAQRASDAEKRADIAHQRFADVDQRAGDAEKAVNALKQEMVSAQAKAQEGRDDALHAERVARAAQKEMRTAQACVVELEARQREREAHAREVAAREDIVVERESQLLARETRLRAREIALENQERLLVAREVEMNARPERVLELVGMVTEAELEQKVHELEARPRKKTKTKRR
uniref:Uncharacterized protein n=1 Tax=Schizophyllum commune (strain H4-8 / FGSC 9210) TaxID=578458 RepID=D8QI11_SCHCM